MRGLNRIQKRRLNTLFCSILALLISGTLQAQISYAPITVSKKTVFKKKVYTRCDVDMNADQLMKLLAKDAAMESYVVPMATYRMFDRILMSAGTVMLSLPIVDALQSQANPNWKLAYVGGALLAASIPFRVAFNKKANRAVSYYNAGYWQSSHLDMKLKAGANQLGLVVCF